MPSRTMSLHRLAVCVSVLCVAATMTAMAAVTNTSRDSSDEATPVDNLLSTPPMGWNSWNTFDCDIDEEMIRETADAMVDSGMRDAGYEYVNIDDCWMAPERDWMGRLQPDPERFPNGIDALADYVHARGLKLGIYSSAGSVTCQGYPASLGYERVDAQTFAEWGVDYLKYDNCGDHDGKSAQERYKAMGDALEATGRDIVYSLCEWGYNDPELWGNDVGANVWRTTRDITDTWGSVMSILDQQVGLEEHSGPNAWNDPDMLEVGNSGLTYDQSRAHMSLWAVLNAPLLAGNDLRDMPQSTVDKLTDPDVLAVNQDWAGAQGRKVRDDGDVEVWAKPMSGGGAAVVLLNRGDAAQTVTTSASELDIDGSGSYELRDVWADTVSSTEGPIEADVASEAAEMFVIEPSGSGAGMESAVSNGDLGALSTEAAGVNQR